MKGILRLVSILFTGGALATVALLMGSHPPFRSTQAASGFAQQGTGHWRAVYILGAGCACSRRVAEHLAGRGKETGLEEQIILVGADTTINRELRSHDWPLEQWPAARTRDTYGAISAPLVAFVDPAGKTRYLGGLSRRADSRDGFHEKEIWAALQAGGTPVRLPAYGCALRF